MTSCCIEWADKSLNVMSFNIYVFIFVYIVPMSLIFYFNTVLILMVTLIGFYKDLKCFFLQITSFPTYIKMKRWTTLFGTLNQQSILTKRMSIQKNITTRNVILIGCFVISWTPYAIVAMIIVFIDTNSISPLLALIPSIFAKSSFLWSPLIFILFDKRIRFNRLFNRAAAAATSGTENVTTPIRLNF